MIFGKLSTIMPPNRQSQGITSKIVIGTEIAPSCALLRMKRKRHGRKTETA